MWNPETPGVSPDTPKIPHPETPGINPDTPEIPDIPDWNPDIPVLQGYERRVVRLVVFVIG